MYPNSLESMCSSKFVSDFCIICNESFSITIPFIKNIKSFSVVEVKFAGAEAVIALKLDVVELIKLPVCTNDFLK